LDFSQLMKRFDEAKVAFVSVTQLFNTANSMGRLMLNVLLSFAQFEREIISERTRDKIAATRRKGKWAGGRTILGFEVDGLSRRLVIVEPEAERVRAIYELYLELGSLLPVVEEVHKRDWRNKSGREFNRNTLYLLLSNVLYAGQVRYKLEVHPGEHPALLDPTLWERVQTRLHRHGRGGVVRKPSGALLQGVLRCGPCQSSMTPTYSCKGGRKYHYYVCSSAQKLGRSSCPTKSVAAGTMDTLVVDQLQRLTRAVPEGESTPPWQAVLRERFSDWSGLGLPEQGQVLRELLERIEYDGRTSQLAFEFREPEAEEPVEEGSC
jgi:site-specific DNA recombinase